MYPSSHFLVIFPLAVGNIDTNEGDQRALEELQVQLMNRKIWMASSIHKGEEKGSCFCYIMYVSILKTSHGDEEMKRISNLKQGC